MRRLFKLALVAGTTVSLFLLGHTAPAVQFAASAPAPSPASAPLAELPSAKPAHHPFRAAMATLGLASWYGASWDGRPTASGEAFDKDKLTACHRTLPFGTIVRVIDVRSGRSVVVRINDRGTLAPGRIIDLSSGAASQLGILQSGLAKVRLEIVQKARSAAHSERPL